MKVVQLEKGLSSAVSIQGSLLGEVRIWSARSKYFTEVLMMKRGHFDRILEEYPEEGFLVEIALNCMKIIDNILGVECYVWGENGK